MTHQPDPAPAPRHEPGADEALPLRKRLRRIPALAGPLPTFDPADVPDEPVELFLRWFEEALAAGVPEPHAVTIATVDAAGAPSARVVVLKDVRDGRLEFATDTRSDKVADLQGRPAVSASFYWQPQGRQVRLTGTAALADADTSAADFLARSPGSRAAALATRPGEPLPDVATLHEAMDRARELVDREPGTVLPEWAVVAIEPTAAEFWQGDPGRAHVRLRYRRDAGGTWTHELVWP